MKNAILKVSDFSNESNPSFLFYATIESIEQHVRENKSGICLRQREKNDSRLFTHIPFNIEDLKTIVMPTYQKDAMFTIKVINNMVFFYI